MDTDPATGLAYYFEWNTNGYRFARWDPVTRTNTTIRTYSPAPGFFATQMAFAPDGTLYMIDSSARLRTIDKVTGALTDRGAISGMTNGPYGQVGDLAIAPNGTAYVATYGNLYSLNLATRAATLLQSNMFGTPTKVWLGLAFCDGTLYGSNVDGTNNRSSIYTINPATGATSVVHNLSVYVTDLTACV
jgi:hypothetical protein